MSDNEFSDVEDTKYDSDKEDNDVEILTKKKSIVVADSDDDDDGDVINDSDDDNEFEEDLDGSPDKVLSGLASKTNISNIENTYQEISPVNSDIDSDDEDYLERFNDNLKKKYIEEYHPECLVDNIHVIEAYTKVTRNKEGIIIDENHKTIPFLTKFEKTKIIGQRIQQLNNGAKPYIQIKEDIIDNNIIANAELQEKKIPFIIRRPLPNNNFEYWKLQDLELID